MASAPSESLSAPPILSLCIHFLLALMCRLLHSRPILFSGLFSNNYYSRKSLSRATQVANTSCPHSDLRHNGLVGINW